MSDYKRKLRSGKILPDIEIPQKKVENNKDEPTSPKTPPSQSFEQYFPPSPFGRKRHQLYGDRLIPCRDRNIVRDFQMLISASNNTSETSTVTDDAKRFNAYFRAELLDDLSAVDDFTSNIFRPSRRVLQYTTTHNNSNSNSSNSTHSRNLSSPIRDSSKFDSPTESKYKISPIGEAGQKILLTSDRCNRHINTTPIKILDAPDLQDDFYLNLVDWGINNTLAIGLGTCVYLWNANTSQVTQLCDLVSDTITSVNWAHMGSLLAVGANSGRTLLYDTVQLKLLRTWLNHTSRIGSMAWKLNILTTGGRDHGIYHHDVRSPNPYLRKLIGHKQEICGLKWNKEGTMLASGGNDNKLFIWDSLENSIEYQFTQHKAAVKAISWNPHKRGILVSGGGTSDKTIKFWNAISGNLISSHDTDSQVCNLYWSKNNDEIISTHGYSNAVNSSNQVVVWKADKMQKIATLTGHTSRVLYMAMNKDGNTIVTGAADETLRFWDISSSVENTRHVYEDRRSCLR